MSVVFNLWRCVVDFGGLFGMLVFFNFSLLFEDVFNLWRRFFEFEVY